MSPTRHLYERLKSADPSASWSLPTEHMVGRGECALRFVGTDVHLETAPMMAPPDAHALVLHAMLDAQGVP